MKKFFENIFSLKLYLQGIKKIRAVGIAAAICVIIPNALIPITRAMNRSVPGNVYTQEIRNVTYNGFAPFISLMMIFAPLMVHSMFSYLNKRSRSDFYHSLPQKRSCVYTSFMMAVVSWIFGVLAVSVTLNMLLWAFVPNYVVDSQIIVSALFYVFVGALLIASYMALAMSLTGTKTSNILVFLLIIFVPRLFALMFIERIEQIIRVIDISSSALKFISFEHFLPLDAFLCFMFGADYRLDIEVLFYSLAVALAIIAVAGILYKTRRSETAQTSAPNKIMQTVYRTAIASLIISSQAVSFIDRGSFGSLSSILSNLALALIAYLIFELMTTRKLKSMVKSIALFWIPVAVGLSFLGAIMITEFTVESITPSADEIKSITVVDRYKTLNLDRTNYPLGMYDTEITAYEAREIVSEVLEENIEYEKEIRNNYSSGYWEAHIDVRKVEIELNSGIRLTRIIRFSHGEYKSLKNAAIGELDGYKSFVANLLPRERITGIKCGDINVLPGSYKFDYLLDTFESEYYALAEEERIQYRLTSESYGEDLRMRRTDYILIKYNVDGIEHTYTFLLSDEHIPKTSYYVRNNIFYSKDPVIK